MKRLPKRTEAAPPPGRAARAPPRAERETARRVELPPLPRHVRPMLARAGPYPKDETAWAFEVKWDGIRAIGFVERGRVRLQSRNLLDITAQYPELASLAEILGDRSAILDGEIVAFNDRGLPSFQKLQGRLGVTAARAARERALEIPIVYLVFDVLHLDGRDTTKLTYEERRGLLDSLGLHGAHVQVSQSFLGQGKALLSTPGLEGVVAKRLGSRYDPGARSPAWIKVKTQRRQEFVIAGWTPGQGSRGGSIGALLLGYYDDEGLRYAGSVGTGFTDAFLRELGRALGPERVAASPFVDPVERKDARFVRPALVAEIEFTEWTNEGRLRHPSFKGLRDDKSPREVVREEEPTHA